MKNILSRKAYLIIFAIFTAIILTGLICSCGTDDIVNNGGNNPPPTTNILSMDSVTIRIGIDPIFETDSTINFSNTDPDSLKITFYAETNADQTLNPKIDIIIQDTTTHSFLGVAINQEIDFNRDYTYYCKTNNLNYQAWFHTRVNPNSPLGTYVKIKSIRITRVQ